MAQNAPSEQSAVAHDNVLQEVIVTASRKRSENVQTTPIAVTAVSNRLLERAHITNFDQFGQLVPDLQIFHNSSSAGLADVYLRGFGSNSNDPSNDPHVATFVDGIYQPASVGDLFDTFDVAQIEVDAGPQGTLAGKNAAIGSISITSAKPTGDFSGELEGDYGSYDHFGARAFVNVPIIKGADGSSILATRFSVVEKEGGNWIYNQANGKRDMGGENDKGGRFAMAFTPDSNFTWNLNAILDMNRDPQAGPQEASFVGGVAGTPSNARQPPLTACRVLGPSACPLTEYGTTDSTFTTRERSDYVNVASNMSYRFTPVTLTSLTGYTNYWLDTNLDDSGTPYAGLFAYNDVTSYDFESEELRLSSNKAGGWDLDGLLDWVVGGYFSNYAFFNSNHLGALNFAAPIGVANVNQDERGVDQSEAVFAHLIFNFTDKWTGTFGVRQSWDQKVHSFEASGTNSFRYDLPAGFHNTSFEVGTAYQFDSQRMAYFRFSQGYQAGGFAGFAIGDIYQPELNNAFEVGLKSDWLNKRLRVNVDLFENELSQLQVASAVAIPTPPGFLQETLNAGSATVEGMEAQIVAVPVQNLTTHLSLGYLHTKYDKFIGTTCANPNAAGAFVPTDCSGIPFSNAPKWTINLGGDYVQDLPSGWPFGGGSLTYSADWNYKSTVYPSDPPFPTSKQEGFGLVNLGLAYRDPTDQYSLEFYGTNVLDRHYKIFQVDPAAGATGGLGAAWGDGRPAEWGLRFTYKFGEGAA